jgi:hypothetical protein
LERFGTFALFARVGIVLVASAVMAGNGRRVPRGAFVIHRIGILDAGTGRLPPAPKIALMLKSVFAAFLLVATLCACQENKPNETALISGGGNVKVLQIRFVSTNEAAIGLSGGSITYVMARVELTNDTNQVLYPTINRLYLLDSSTGSHITGNDSGSSAFIGISNNLNGMKPGEKREFTVGFRADPNTTGTVLYDYT